ncbi:MAG: DNRLRE domain-containing protein [Chitinophagaceae bacterium]
MIFLQHKPFGMSGSGFVFLGLMFLMLLSTAQAQTLTPTDDAQVYAGSVANNYGADVKLQVKKKEGSSITRNAYLKFDLTGITVDQVGKAKLRLYCNNKAVDTVQSVMAAYATSSGWTEAAIKWNNAPAFGATLTTTVIVAKTGYYEWDITEYIKQAIPLGTQVSVAIADVNFSNNLVELSSKEAANKPQLVISATPDVPATAYFLDAVSGNDSNDGLSAGTAWKSLSKINVSYLSPGAKIYFKSGQSFNGMLNISNTGASGNPVVCDIYGGTTPATINGLGQPSAVFAYNRAYIELKNLRVTNFRPGIIAAADAFSAITFIIEDAGVVNHIYLDKVIVDSVNSSTDVNDGYTVYNGGVRFYTGGSTIPTNFNDVKVTNCTFQNLGRTGCNFDSEWALRNVNTHFGDPLGDGRTDNWVPNTNVVFLSNIFRKIGGNGLIVRVAYKALIEGNYFDSCGTDISGNAVFNFNTDSCVYQFNEAKHTVYNSGDTDARGIDSDFRTKYTIIQYNYLHDNELGGVVATGGDQTSGQIPQRFNIGTVIRYNLIENNARQGISFSGAIDGLDVYNNTIYADATHNDVLVIRSAIWAVAPKNIRYKNNIFYYAGTNPSYFFASGSTYTFTNNLFYGTHPASEPFDAAKITGDPKLSGAGLSTDGYKYLEGSAALNSGIVIADNGGRDYYGGAVAQQTAPNVGMYNGAFVAGLPLTLNDFFASKEAGTIALSWTTASEMHTSHFELERSADGRVFEKIGTVHATGNSNSLLHYSFIDINPIKGLGYYRMKMVDTDGKWVYSTVRLVSFDGAIKGLIVYPNPADSHISLAFNTVSAGAVTVNIFDMQGKQVITKNVARGSNPDINISSLVRGIYSVQVAGGEGNTVIGTARLLKL